MFLESKCENAINMMKSVIGFASVLVNFSSTVKSIPLTSYSQCPTPLKTWKWNLVMKRESWLLREILHRCKRCEDLWDIQLNGKYIIVTVLIINNKFWKCYLYPFACSLFLALFTSFFMILFFFFYDLQKVIFMVILGSNPADFDLYACLLCRQI